MTNLNDGKYTSAVFLTFSGNCKEALTFYQTCFGGTLQFQTYERELQGYKEMPVISGALIAESIVIHGSDLVHNEGRILGNNIAIAIHCIDTNVRKDLAAQLSPRKEDFLTRDNEKLIEVVDDFDVRWVLYV